MKKLVGAVVAVFVLFYLFTEPRHAADVVRGAVGLLGNGFDAVVAFLSALFR
jgi:hypothetical protein